MALTGSKPKADRSQVRFRGESDHVWTEVEDVPFMDAPPLPPRTMAEGPDAPVGALDRWPDATQRWYRAISRMPHAKLWRPAQWEFVFTVAESHARFMEGWKGHGGAELRIREAKLGTTDESLRDLRIRYVPAGTMAKRRREQRAATGTDGKVSKMADYRDL